MTTQAVILAAGMGTRLGRPWPKPLTPLADGRTIMRQQIDNLQSAFEDVRITTVVGFKLELILEAFPNVGYVYNENYDQTNTNRSLLKALRLSMPGGVLWMNGDVVFDAHADACEMRRNIVSALYIATRFDGEDHARFQLAPVAVALVVARVVHVETQPMTGTMHVILAVIAGLDHFVETAAA